MRNRSMFGEVGEDKKHTQLAATVSVQSKTRQTKQGAARKGGEVAAQQVTGDPRRIRSSNAKQQRPLVDKQRYNISRPSMLMARDPGARQEPLSRSAE